MNNTCQECKRTVPDLSYLNPLITSDGTIQAICAPCALILSNKFSGTNRLEFDGRNAERLRKETLKHYQDTNQQ